MKLSPRIEPASRTASRPTMAPSPTVTLSPIVTPFWIVTPVPMVAASEMVAVMDTQASPNRAPLASVWSRLTLAAGLLCCVVGCNDADPCPPGTDPFEVVSHEVRGQFVRLDIQYSGGCAEHDFAVWWTGIASGSCPGGVPLELQHYASGDTCDALVTESIWVDLSPVVDGVGFCNGGIRVNFVIDRGRSVLSFQLEEGTGGSRPPSEEVMSIDLSCGVIDA